jgi:type IV pilus assembly protein PilC
MSVRDGNEMAEAMRAQGRAFPTLMIEMVEVAERTGALPEILRGLADHYDNNLRLRRTFFSAIAWPVFQLLAAIFVNAIVIFVLGLLGGGRGQPYDVLGLGLHGTTGAILWLMMTLGTLTAIVVGYLLFRRTFASQQVLDPLLLQIPVIGHSIRSFAIARFSWAFSLTQQAGMSMKESLRSSLRATSNGAYMAAARPMWEGIHNGQTLTEAMAETRLFPPDYLQIVEVAEEAGAVPERLEQLSPQFEDQARRALGALTVALGWAVWTMGAGFMIFLIFRIVLGYIGQINDLAREPGRF